MEVEVEVPEPLAVVGIAAGARSSTPRSPLCLCMPLLHSSLFMPSLADLRTAFGLIERYVASPEPRLMTQALKLISPALAKGKGEPSHVVAAISEAAATFMPTTAELRTPLAELLATLPTPAPNVLAAAKGPEPVTDQAKPEKRLPAKLPEHEVFIGLLALLLLLDMGNTTAAMPWALMLMERVAALKRRTLDPIAERVYFYASWVFEKGNQLAAIRSTLLAAYRTACLHHNTICQATLLNSLLRNLLHHKLFDQAEKLLTKTTFPEQATNAQASEKAP